MQDGKLSAMLVSVAIHCKSLTRSGTVIIAGLLAAASPSCRTVKFYTQAARGQWEILHKAQPIDTVRQDPKTPADTKKRLDEVTAVRVFASRHLGLKTDGQYDRYADLGRPYVVWVVFATPEFSMEPKTWWYPMLGSLAYRGYFNEADARAEAARLRKQGLDVFGGGVDAYSTLGWFRDPVLNTFLRRDEADLAELIFHELTHQRIYFSGDIDFNEALATAVGREGVRRWLRSEGRTKDLRDYISSQAVEDRFIAAALATREELRQLYANEAHAAPEELRIKKAAVYAKLKRKAMAMVNGKSAQAAIEKWFSKSVNNARLNSLSSYYDLVPAFDRLLAKHAGDLEAFFNDLSKLKRHSPAERRHALGLPLDEATSRSHTPHTTPAKSRPAAVPVAGRVSAVASPPSHSP